LKIKSIAVGVSFDLITSEKLTTVVVVDTTQCIKCWPTSFLRCI